MAHALPTTCPPTCPRVCLLPLPLPAPRPVLPLQEAVRPLRHGYDHVLAEKVLKMEEKVSERQWGGRGGGRGSTIASVEVTAAIQGSAC